MDQRGSLKKSLAAEKSVPSEEIGLEIMSESKTAVIRVLSPFASGVLLDPEYGLQAANERYPGVGLLIACEQSGYDNMQPGRLPKLLPDWTVSDLKDAGASCIKLLIYYSPFEETSVNDQKKAFVEQVGFNCGSSTSPSFWSSLGTIRPANSQAWSMPAKKPKSSPRVWKNFRRRFAR